MFRCSVCITDLCDIIVWFAAVHYGARLLILLTVRQIYPMEATTMKKFRNKKGFTLAELLIVLAIIAILMAIAIPLFSNQLEKARISVDEANARSASSMAQAHYLITHINESSPITYYFNITNGNLEIAGHTVPEPAAQSYAEDEKSCGLGSAAANGNMTAESDRYADIPFSVTITEGKITNSWLDSH